MQEGLNQNILKGYCSQRIFGPNAQTLFTWSSFWESFSEWEKAIYDRPAFNLLRVINGRLTRYDPTTDVFLLHKVEESKYRSLKNHASILTSDGEGQHYGFKYH